MINETRWIGAWSSGWWIVFNSSSYQSEKSPVRVCRGGILRLAAGVFYGVLLVLSSPAVAQTVLDPSAYTNRCAGCHNIPSTQFPPVMRSQSAEGKIFTWRALNYAPSETAVLANMRNATLISIGSPMHAYFNSAIGAATDAELSSIYRYLRTIRDAEVTVGAPNPAIPNTVLGSSSSSTIRVTVYNYRGVGLKYALDIERTTALAGEFSITSATSGTCAGTASSTPNSCVIDTTVRFAPSTASRRTARLNVVLSAENPLDPNPGDQSPLVQDPNPLPNRSVDLAGDGLSPLAVSVGSQLLFTSPVNLTQKQNILLSNRRSTSLTITPTLTAQATAAGYTIAPDSTCQPGTVLAANSGSCTLIVVFSPLSEVAATPGAKLSLGYDGLGSPTLISLNGIATADLRAVIQLSADAPPAVEAQVGSSASMQTITLYNRGGEPLQFTSFDAGGAAPAEFVRGGTCSLSTQLQVGPESNSATSCTLQFTFRPSVVGTRTAVLDIRSNATVSPLRIDLQGTGVPVPAPKLQWSETSQLDFKFQTIGGIYPPRSVTLTNTGNAPLSIAGLVVEGAAFTNVSTTPCPASLAGGASCTIDIRFSPTAATNYTGILRLTSNAAGSPHTLALLGSGTATAVPILEWASPVGAELDFGLVSAGTVSATQSVTFVSRGPGGVDLSFVNAVGADAAAFSVDASSCPIGRSLFQDTPCRVDIRFSPGSGGPKSATLQIVSSGSAPATLRLTGTGLGNPAAGLSLSTSAMIFESVRVGAQSAPVELTLSGTGSGAVNVTGLQVSGPYSVQAKTCATVPFVLNAGSSCTVAVIFQPQGEGSAAGTLRVTSDASPAVREIALNGNGQAAANVSSGGCSIASGDARFDPTLWALVVLAGGALAYRRRARAARDRQQ